MSADYLLGLTEQKEQHNTELAELHLDDHMIELLKSGRINNRLLCEFAEHENFLDLMSDMEIYVDGIATMQIQNLNSYLVTVRNEIINKYQPEESDHYLKTLEAAQIDENRYFSHIVHDDIDVILKDIRQAHSKDSTSAPVNTVAEELKKDIEFTSTFKGSDEEKITILYCKRLGINYKKLTLPEFRTLAQILQKSKHINKTVSKRGKKK